MRYSALAVKLPFSDPGTFLNDSASQQNDYFRLSLPAGQTVTALLNGLTVD